MNREELSDLVIFKAVAEENSFTRASVRLGLSQSTVSQIITNFEARLGVRLLARTTRSVRMTEAGRLLLDAVQPAFADLDARLGALADLRDKPSGTIRITTITQPALAIVLPMLPAFAEEYPDVKVELSFNDAFTDIVAGGFDAGIRFGEHVEKDMVGVPIGPDMRAAIVASPAYFARYGVPATPRDLSLHNCIRFRLASMGDIYRWRFWENGNPIDAKVEGFLTVNDGNAVVEAALSGLGLAYLFEDRIAELIAAGRLVRCLVDWCPPFPGYYLYYSSRRQKPAALSVFIDRLRYRAPG